MRRTLFLLFYSTSVFLFQELLFRYVFPIPELKNLDRAIFWNANPNNPRIDFQRNQTKYWQSSIDTSELFVHYMNSYGFRDSEWYVKKKNDESRVLSIGDSFVEGIMASQEQTIPKGFLNQAGGNIEVMNAGMVGQGLDVYLQLMADLIPIYKPDMAVLCIYSNDLGPREPKVPQHYLVPEEYSFLAPRFLEVIVQLISGNPLTTRWSSEMQPYLNPVPETTNPWTRHEDELRPRVTEEIATEMIQGRFNPARTNDLFIEEFYLKRIPKLGETIPFFQYVCKQTGTEPLVVYIPSKNQVSKHYLKYEKEMCLKACGDSIDLTTSEYNLHQSIIAEQCKVFDVNFIDLTEDIESQEELDQHLYWNYDEHMRGYGYVFCGQMIYSRWKRKLFD